MDDQTQLPPSSSKLFKCIGMTFCVSCTAISILSVFLFLSIIFVVLKVPFGAEPITLGLLLKKLFFGALVPVLKLVSDILRAFSPWGFIVAFLTMVVFWGPSRIREILFSAKFELPGGFKYDGTSLLSSFRRELGEAARIVDRANREIGEAYEYAKLYALQLQAKHTISEKVAELAVKVGEIIGPACPTDFRLTLYVADFVFSDRLFQFTEYFDKAGSVVSERKAGRTFSVRYGIIGRVWRSGVDEIEGNIISHQDRDEMQNPDDVAELERFIARRWGLSLEEAIHVKKYRSYGALKIERADRLVGLLYFDSKGIDAFGNNDQMLRIQAEIKSQLSSSSLVGSLLEISSEVAPWSGRIQVFRSSR